MKVTWQTAVAVVGFVGVIVGAAVLWGAGGAVFAGGVALFIDSNLDR
jgi:hypothetical protein